MSVSTCIRAERPLIHMLLPQSLMIFTGRGPRRDAMRDADEMPRRVLEFEIFRSCSTFFLVFLIGSDYDPLPSPRPARGSCHGA